MARTRISLPVDCPPLVRDYGIEIGSLLAGWKVLQNEVRVWVWVWIEVLRDFEAILIARNRRV